MVRVEVLKQQKKFVGSDFRQFRILGPSHKTSGKSKFADSTALWPSTLKTSRKSEFADNTALWPGPQALEVQLDSLLAVFCACPHHFSSFFNIFHFFSRFESSFSDLFKISIYIFHHFSKFESTFFLIFQDFNLHFSPVFKISIIMFHFLFKILIIIFGVTQDFNLQF